MNVLIVDDNQKVRQMMKDFLFTLFDNFYECSNGKDAVAIYTKYHPDWVLMDIKMKGINGIESLKQINQIDPNAKVIMVTQYDDNDLRKASSEYGAVAYVLKENLSGIENFINNYQGAKK